MPDGFLFSCCFHGRHAARFAALHLQCLRKELQTQTPARIIDEGVAALEAQGQGGETPQEKRINRQNMKSLTY